MTSIITTQRVSREELSGTCPTTYFLIGFTYGKERFPLVDSVTKTNTGLVFLRSIEEAEERGRQVAARLGGSCVFVPNGGVVYTVKPLKDGAFAARTLAVANGKISATGQGNREITFAAAAAQAERLATAGENNRYLPHYYTNSSLV